MDNLYNSSGKPCGTIEFLSDKILIHDNHGELELTDIDILKVAKSKDLYNNKDIVLRLYDEFTLSISIIAGIFDVHYHEANAAIKSMNSKSAKKSGRRNSSYGKKFSQQRKKNMIKKRIGSHIYNDGEHEHVLTS